MEVEDGFIRTVESLRGRLQAERAASMAANKDAEFMHDKLKELEQQLETEIKARKREEKRLNSLRKKLESLNLVYTPRNLEISSEQSSISEFSYYCTISSTASTGFRDAEERGENLSEPAANNSGSTVVGSEDAEGEDRSSVSEGMMSRKMMDLEDSWSKSRQSDDEQKNPSQKSADSTSDHPRSVMEMGNNEEDKDYVDNNTMALVPVIKPEESEPTSSINEEMNYYTKSGNVRQVLDTLKQIREKLQSSIGDRSRTRRRHIIKVG